jgi:protein-S-isoprenylcysteine O-methyltransferase Ste14
MKTSPDDIVQYAWLLWLISWLAAAVWSSETERRPSRRDEMTYRLVIAAGAVLLFGLYRRWVSFDIVVWRPGRDAAWALVAITICGFQEGFLRDKLGEDQYNAYARRVPMLIPFRL